MGSLVQLDLPRFDEQNGNQITPNNGNQITPNISKEFVGNKNNNLFPSFTPISNYTSNQYLNLLDSQKKKENLFNQEITTLFGGNYDPIGELDDNMLEFNMAKGKTLTAKQQAFNEKYPEGSLVPMTMSNGNVKLFFTKKPEDKFRIVNKGINVPELSAAVLSGETVGGIVGSVLGGRVAGAKGSMIGTGLGTTAGSLAETGFQKLLGRETLPIKDEIMEAGTEGLIASGIDLATRKAFSLFNKFKTGGNIKILDTTDFADDIAKFAENEMLEPVVKGNVVKSPLWKGAYEQSTATSTLPKDISAKQILSLQNKFKSISSTFDETQFSDEQLRAILQAQKKEIETKIKLSFKNNISLDQVYANAGEDFVTGIKNWKNATASQRNKLYEKAFELADDVVFDITKLKNVAKNVKSGVVGEGKESAIQLRKLSPELKDLINDIDGLNSKVTKFQGFESLEQLKEIRTRLFDLQQSNDPSTKRFANKLFSSLKESMENPATGNKQFLDEYKRASAYNIWRESLLNKTVLKKSLNSDSPEDIVSNYFNITQPSEVKFIKEIFKNQPEKLQVLKNSYLFEIINDKATLNKFINKEDKFADVVKQIFTKEESLAINKFAQAKKQLNNSTLKKIIGKDVANQEKAYAIMNEGYNSFKSFITKSGGKNSNTVKSIKSGVYKKLLDDSTITNDQGKNLINVNSLIKGIEEIKNNKALMDFVFDAKDIAKLDNYNLYLSISDVSQDVGGAMQKGSTVAKFKKIGDLTGKIDVGHTMLSNSLIAKILSQPYKAGDDVIIRTDKITSNKIKYLTVALGNIYQQSKNEKRLRVPFLENK